MKVCKRCGIEKDEADFYLYSNTKKLRAICKQCTKEDVKRWKDKNPNAQKLYNTRSKIKHPERNKELSAKGRKNLDDRYIKRVIKQTTGLSYNLITPEMIETKRYQIWMKRKVDQDFKERIP